MFSFLVVALCVGAVLASDGDCKPPSTDFDAIQCLDNPPVSVSGVSMTPYPADPSVPIDLKFTYDDNTQNSYDNLKVDVTLEYFGNLIFHGCGFHKLPIILDNLDGCKVVHNCPLTPGSHPNDFKVDLSPFAAIIKTLANDTYYRLNVTVKASDKSTKLSCLSAKFLLDAK